jgi:ComF family protein
MKMFSWLEAVIDTVLPPKERTARTKALALEAIPLAPTAHDLLGTRIITLMDYRRQEVRDLIQSLKYDGGKAAARLCAATLAEYLGEELSHERLFSRKRTLLVPVPLHASRSRERGYNQIGVVLEMLPLALRDGTRASLAPGVLMRSRATRPQTRLPRSERLSNVAGAFELAAGAEVKGARIFLIDDVATTGATLVNAATPLRRAGAEVTLLALARA